MCVCACLIPENITNFKDALRFEEAVCLVFVFFCFFCTHAYAKIKHAVSLLRDRFGWIKLDVTDFSGLIQISLSWKAAFYYFSFQSLKLFVLYLKLYSVTSVIYFLKVRYFPSAILFTSCRSSFISFKLCFLFLPLYSA